jgi:hypothetical protein
MGKQFNVAGPCFADRHYMIEAAERLKSVERLIEEEHYFVIHAARQSGKTTYLQDLERRLNGEKKYYTLYCTFETLEGVTDAEKGIPEVIRTIRNALIKGKIARGEDFARHADYSNFTGVLQKSLSDYCCLLDKPLVLLLDEVDTMSGDTMVSFLRQIRAGYIERKPLLPSFRRRLWGNVRGSLPYYNFPVSVALVGMRDLRDYKMKIRSESETQGSVSPFNIKLKSLTLNNFTREEVAQLYGQHTKAEGQVFEQEAIDMVYDQTGGQPWLVNAIAREIIEETLEKDYRQPVTATLVRDAIQTIIRTRPTHIDSLMERLKEPRVRHIVEPMILGEIGPNPADDDYLYCLDLGLVRQESGRLIPTNPIYAEVIARKLSEWPQMAMTASDTPANPNTFFHDAQIDISRLLEAFRHFWRENSEVWIEKLDYTEAAAHLVTFAFLQRVVNGGGLIIREMATGRGKLDICILYKDHKYPIELKVRRQKDSLETILSKGLAQLSGYMDTLGCQEGWLLVFDKREGIPWEQKLFRREESSASNHITVFGA